MSESLLLCIVLRQNKSVGEREGDDPWDMTGELLERHLQRAHYKTGWNFRYHQWLFSTKIYESGLMPSNL